MVEFCEIVTRLCPVRDYIDALSAGNAGRVTNALEVLQKFGVYLGVAARTSPSRQTLGTKDPGSQPTTLSSSLVTHEAIPSALQV